MDRAGFCRGAACAAAAAGLAATTGLQPSLAADVMGGTGRNNALQTSAAGNSERGRLV